MRDIRIRGRDAQSTPVAIPSTKAHVRPDLALWSVACCTSTTPSASRLTRMTHIATGGTVLQ